MRHTIPIPSSFSTGISSQDSSENNNPTRRCRIPIHEQWLIKLESALQLYFVRTKSNQISLEQLGTLVPKLELERDEKDESESLLLLETSERLWHDFICVVVPTLYTLSIEDEELHMVRDFPGNRLQEVQRLVRVAQEQGVLESLSLQILDSLAKRQEILANNKKTMVEPKTTDPVETTDSSNQSLTLPKVDKISTLSELETRIRAKAQERLRHLERAHEEAPYDDRIRVADAIFAWARKRLRQRPGGRFRTASLVATTNINTKCRVVASDLLAQAVPGYTVAKFLTILQRLAQDCPGWISWDNDDRIDLKTTVTIETAHYKTVRSSITGTLEEVQTPQQDTKRSLPVVTVSGSKRVSRTSEEQTSHKQARVL